MNLSRIIPPQQYLDWSPSTLITREQRQFIKNRIDKKGPMTSEAINEVTIVTLPNGVKIINTSGLFSIEILSRKKEKSAFWYKIVPSIDFKFVARIIHTSNVIFKVEGKKQYLDVRAFRVIDTNDVPWQGEVIGDDHPGNYFTDDIKKFLGTKLSGKGIRVLEPSRKWRQDIGGLVDAVISPIPLIGDIYDFANIAWAKVGGADLFGRKVSNTQILLFGVSLLLPVAISRGLAHKRAKALAQEQPKSALKLLLDKIDLADVEYDALKIDIVPALNEAILALSEAELKQLTTTTRSTLKGGKATVQDLLDQIESVIGQKYATSRSRLLREAIENGTIPKDFLDTVEGTNNWVLQEGYNKYLGELRALAGKNKIEYRPNDAYSFIQWALKRQSQGKYHDQLVATYGSNWRNAFSSLMATSSRVNLPEATRNELDKIFTPALRHFNDKKIKAEFESYKKSIKKRQKSEQVKTGAVKTKSMRALDWAISRKGTKLEAEFEKRLGKGWQETLKSVRGDYVVTKIPESARDTFQKLHSIDHHVKLTEANKYFGHYFESDHLFGQQFWRNNPFLDGFAELEDGLAMLVPKNASIAKMMEEHFKYVPYDHATKSRLIRELIPDGTELLWSPQQLWDVHVYVYHNLGALDTVGPNLEGMFKIYQELLLNSGFNKSEVAIDFNLKVDKSFIQKFSPGIWISDWNPAWPPTGPWE